MVLALAGVAAAVVARSGKAASGADATKDKDGKPIVTLEFTPREVVAPTLAAMPTLIEFSGPLVAPQTAVVGARAVVGPKA